MQRKKKKDRTYEERKDGRKEGRKSGCGCQGETRKNKTGNESRKDKIPRRRT